MAITIETVHGPVVLREMFDDFAKGISGQGPYRIQRYLCPFEASDDVADALMGLTYGVGGINGTIIRQAPHRHPAQPNLFVVDLGRIEGIGKPIIDGGRVRYDYSVITATYGVPTFQLGGSLNTVDPFNALNFDAQVYPYVTQNISYDSESYTMEANWKYAEGPPVTVQGKPITGSQLTINVNVATMNLTIHRIPFLPTQRLFSLLKRTNDATFLGQPAGTVMFDQVRTNRVKNTDGTNVIDMDMTYRWREPGWNKVPDPTDGSTWLLFTHDGGTGSGSRRAYPPADLRGTLFGVDLS